MSFDMPDWHVENNRRLRAKVEELEAQIRQLQRELEVARGNSRRRVRRRVGPREDGAHG